MFGLTEGRQCFYTLLFYEEVANFTMSFHSNLNSKTESKEITQDELNKVKCFFKDFIIDLTKAFDDEAKYSKHLFTRDEVKGRIKNYFKNYVEDFDNKIKDDKLLMQDEIKGLIKDCLKDYVESFDNKMEDGELLTRGEIKGFIKDLVEDFNNKTKVETKQVTNKAIIIGSVCGVIAGLAVGVGCGVAGAQLSVLAIVGIAVAAVLAVGIVAGVITYAISEPSGRLEEACAQGQGPNKVPA